jgi:hypothetical protein
MTILAPDTPNTHIQNHGVIENLQRIETVGFGTFHAATSSPQRNSSAPPSAVIARRIE